MLKRALILSGMTLFSIMAVFLLLRLMPSAIPVARALAPCVPVTQDITTDRIWTEACYRVSTTTVTIHPNVALTISPSGGGTRVEFDFGAQLQVLGQLHALGTASQPITFTSINTTTPARCDWIGIIIEDDGGGDLIQNSVIEYACTGIKVNDEDYVSILSNTFRYNGNGDSTNGAIGGDVDYALIANNRIFSSTNGIALGEAGGNIIVDNIIYDVDRYGLLMMRGGVGGGSDNFIGRNVISACNSGGIRLEDGFSNEMEGNLIFLNPGGGIYLDEQSVASVRYNHVYSNGGGGGYQAGIFITNTAFVSDVVRNVVYDLYDDAIQYHDSNFGDPVMRNNALCSIPSFELRNDDVATLDGRNSWWGTNTPLAGVNYLGSVDITPSITLSLDGAANGFITVRLRD
jgi:parallel beta-helix repeat protein